MEMKTKPELCRIFPDGARMPELPLEEDECIYGVYREKYYFTPLALIIVSSKNATRIAWSSILSCSSEHGRGHVWSTLQLDDGKQVQVQIEDFGKGWAGRIGQLYHSMIDRWSPRAFKGYPLLTIEDFFSQIPDEYAFAPNLSAHPTLDEIRTAFEEIARHPDVESVHVDVLDYDESYPTSDTLVIVFRGAAAALEGFLGPMRVSGVGPADVNTRKKLGPTADGVEVFCASWD